MFVRTISSKAPNILYPNVVWWCMIMSLNIVQKDWLVYLQGQGPQRDRTGVGVLPRRATDLVLFVFDWWKLFRPSVRPFVYLFVPFVRPSVHSFIRSFVHSYPRGLTFMWWGCCGLCQKLKATEPAHSFLCLYCVYFCPCDPFNCISFHKFSRQLSVLSLCSSGPISCLIGPFSYISLYESLLQPWYNP